MAEAALVMADEKTDEKKDEATVEGGDGGDGLCNLSPSPLAGLEGAEPTSEGLAEALAYLAIAIEQVRGSLCV